MKKTLVLLMTGVILSVLTIGCASSRNRAIEGSIIGGALGAAAGGIIGHQSRHGGEGAAIGAVSGAAAGALIGSQMEKDTQTIQPVTNNQ